MFDTLIIGAASSTGLNGLWTGILNNWITPLYLAAVAIGAFMFIRSQQLTKLIMFLVVAAIVGVLIFGGRALFGDGGQSKGFTKMFEATGNKVATDNQTGISN